ncbi:sulfatase [Salinigranum salinum]|uniref:sulfatase n=1 Tax=Salinigranum salinum TaxID=1364937 RepID=UPI001260D33A|nr:sulfatase [Salinigranum salinum]
MNDVLYVTIDSLRADHVGYHGYERDTTPHLDDLAAEGSTFSNAFAHAGGTKMAFPSLMTSVTPLSYGGYRGGLSDEQTTLAEVFQRGGYRTAGFHSNLYLSEQFGYGRGFDRFFDSQTDASTVSKARQYAKTHLQGTPVYPLLERAYNFAESSGGVNVGSYHVPGDEITDMAIDYIESADTDHPQFLWVHYMDVHHPFLPPAEFQRQFRDDVVSNQESIRLRRKLLEEPENVTEEELQLQLDLYDAEIRHTDYQVRRLLDAAEDHWGGVTTFLTADHGEHFLEHGYFSGAQLYDVKMHVPLLVHGWEYSGSHDETVGITDLPPTMAEYAGLPVPESYQGHSLLSLVRDGVWDRTSIVGGYGNGVDDASFVYRDREWKYIENADGTTELYDLATDPGEQRNVAADHEDLVRQFAGKLNEHRREIERTNVDLTDVEMEEEVRERLRRLGYDE